jgi:hypothetical protein
VVFGSEPTVTNVQHKLDGLADLYRELAAVTGADPDSRPLQVRRISSGTIHLELIGPFGELGLLAWVLLAVGRFLHRNYTREGRADGIFRDNQALLSTLQLADELGSRGLTSEQSDDELRETAKSLFKKTHEVLRSESTFIVNGEAVDFRPGPTRKIGRSDRRSLGPGSESAPPSE